LDKIDNWENLSNSDKNVIISNFLEVGGNTISLIDYFDNYLLNLSNNTLNSYIKGVIKPKI
jgi:cytochrome b pre-mRNA-processing protein 3